MGDVDFSVRIDGERPWCLAPLTHVDDLICQEMRFTDLSGSFLFERRGDGESAKIDDNSPRLK